jgi:hypothetical protein
MIEGFDWFIDENEDVQERVVRGEARGLMKGEIRGLQQSIALIVKSRFPILEGLVQQHIEQINNQDDLNMLIMQLSTATSEERVRWLLNVPTV